MWQRHPDEFVVAVEIVPTKEGAERFDRSRNLLEQMGAANVRMLAPVMAWPK